MSLECLTDGMKASPRGREYVGEARAERETSPPHAAPEKKTSTADKKTVASISRVYAICHGIYSVNETFFTNFFLEIRRKFKSANVGNK